MPVSIEIPKIGAVYTETESVLRIGDASGALLELRVDAGAVFVRSLRGAPSSWTDASLESVVALFATSSPAATFLRTHGANPLRQLVFDSYVGPDPESEAGR